MQLDFHYYATYCAAYLAGFTHEESLGICYSAQFVDCCSETFLRKVGGPRSAATTQLQLELMDADTDPIGLQKITRIWSAFHFLPGDIHAERKRCTKRYLRKYRLICNVNGELLADTVRLAKGRGLQAAGIAMHVLADTWAHRYFAGTPSLVINNTEFHFEELLKSEEGGDPFAARPVRFRHSVSAEDDPENGVYTCSVYQPSENSIMNLGHGRAGHLPDYSFMRYRYLPAWGDYEPVTKDNPSDYMHAFRQMVYALRYLRGDEPEFRTDTYDAGCVDPYKDEIEAILEKRQLDSCDDWKAFARKLSGAAPEDFDIERFSEEYTAASPEEKDDTYLGKFFIYAMMQKSMVAGKIFDSGNLLAGFAVELDRSGLRGMRDYRKIAARAKKGEKR